MKMKIGYIFWIKLSHTKIFCAKKQKVENTKQEIYYEMQNFGHEKHNLVYKSNIIFLNKIPFLVTVKAVRENVGGPSTLFAGLT